MSAQTIYDDLRKAGMTHEGACVMLGNMQCESSLKPNSVKLMICTKLLSVSVKSMNVLP